MTNGCWSGGRGAGAQLGGKKPSFPSSRPRVISPQTCWARQKTFGMKNKLKHTKEKKPLFPLFRCRVIYVWKLNTKPGSCKSRNMCVGRMTGHILRRCEANNWMPHPGDERREEIKAANLHGAPSWLGDRPKALCLLKLFYYNRSLKDTFVSFLQKISTLILGDITFLFYFYADHVIRLKDILCQHVARQLHCHSLRRVPWCRPILSQQPPSQQEIKIQIRSEWRTYFW